MKHLWLEKAKSAAENRQHRKYYQLIQPLHMAEAEKKWAGPIDQKDYASRISRLMKKVHFPVP